MVQPTMPRRRHWQMQCKLKTLCQMLAASTWQVVAEHVRHFGNAVRCTVQLTAELQAPCGAASATYTGVNTATISCDEPHAMQYVSFQVVAPRQTVLLQVVLQPTLRTQAPLQLQRQQRAAKRLQGML